MWAASLAWNGIGTAGLKGAEVQCHMFAHILGAYYDIAHGAALSIITPGWMEFNLEKIFGSAVKVERALLGENVGICSSKLLWKMTRFLGVRETISM